MSLIYIKGVSSTITSPFRFFTELVKLNPIPATIKSFQQELPNSYEGNIFNKFSHEISADGLSFKIEYAVDDAGYADEFGNWIYTPSDNILDKTFTFREEIEKALLSELQYSQTLLTDKWEEKGFDKDSKRWFKNNILHLLKCIDVYQSTSEWHEYQKEFIKPYEALIQFIYEQYPAYVPNTNINENLPGILKLSDTPELTYTPATLSTSIYKKLAELIDDNGESLFGFINPVDTSKKIALFVAQSFEEIIEPIQFNKNMVAAYYTINRLACIQGIKANHIFNANIFSFKGKPFSTSAYYKNINTIRSNNSAIRKLIDRTIDSSLS